VPTLDEPRAELPPVPAPDEPRTELPPVPTPDELRAELRQAAGRSVVLLRNEPVNAVPVLPLASSADRPLRRLAVLGAHADEARFQGGGSASVVPAVSVSPLAGLRAALGGAVEVVYSRGGAVRTTMPAVGTDVAESVLAHDAESGEPGIRVTYLDDAGSVLLEEVRNAGRVTSLEPPPALHGAALARSRIRTVLTARRAGPHELGVSGLGDVTVRVDGEEVLTASMSFGNDPVEAIFGAAGPRTTIELDPDRPVTVEVDHVPLGVGWGSSPTMFIVGLHAAPVGPGVAAELDAAVELAASADAAVVFVGTTEDVETEGVDRASLDLPGRQNELVFRVAAANPRTVTVVTSGGPVLLPWRDEVPATVATGYLGQECGAALADVLTGAVEPTARLPLTWPASADDVIDPTPVDGKLHYTEGVYVGHRGYRERDATPAYWFGAGLGWSSWSYGDLSVTDEAGPTVRVTVRNTGARTGTEVVQVYAAYADEPAPRFAGAARVSAGPGEEATAVITVPARVLLRYDGERMAPRPGPIVVLAGPNSGDLPLRALLP
jgi:beta-glucosidase